MRTQSSTMHGVSSASLLRSCEAVHFGTVHATRSTRGPSNYCVQHPQTRIHALTEHNMHAPLTIRMPDNARRKISTLVAFVSCVAAASGHAQARPMGDTTKMPMPPAVTGNTMAGMMMGPHQALAMAYGESLASFARALNHDVTQSHAVNLDLARPATTEMRRNFDQMKLHHDAHMTKGAMAMGTTMSRDSAMTRPTAMPRPAMSRDSAMRKPTAMKRDSASRMPMAMPSTASASRDGAMTRDSAMARSSGIPRDSAMSGMAREMEKGVAAIGMHLSMLETEVALPTPDATKVAEHTAEILKLCESMNPNRAGAGTTGSTVPK